MKRINGKAENSETTKTDDRLSTPGDADGSPDHVGDHTPDHAGDHTPDHAGDHTPDHAGESCNFRTPDGESCNFITPECESCNFRTQELETRAPDFTPTHYVGIGASAGGLEAIEAFFKNMPPNSGMAFIVIQHLSPDYKSLMVELLSKRTTMPVYRAEEGMRVEADSIYLIPPKKNLTIFHGKLLLKDQDAARGINLPIDIFFRSLAEDQGEKAIGVILSGTGSDGMRGVRAIKESGGMVMVQDEETAKFNGMPRSAISTGMADFVLSPEDMPKQLNSFSRHPYVAKKEASELLLTDEDSLTRIFSLLREKTKVDFTFYKPSTVVRRIERRMMVNQIHALSDYVRYMESYPAEVSSLYRELLIGVTSFFRDADAFDYLGEQVLPNLFRQNRNREFRLWVAGCSTGEEAYTLAILCRECLEKMGLSTDVKIFSTDVDRDAILVAGNGRYPESIAADLSTRLLSKYFYRRDDNFQIVRTIREMVVFAQHNIIKDPPFTNIDLLSCRNLLIYLQPVLQRKAMELFNFSLNPDGILFLGSSETTGEMADFFELVHNKHKIYRSRGKRKAAGPTLDLMSHRDFSGRASAYRAASSGHIFKPFEDERLLERLLEGLSGDYIPLALVVNEEMGVLHVLGDTEGLFRLPTGKMHNDISKMAAQELAIPLATGIQKVFKTYAEVKFTNIRVNRGQAAENLQMRIRTLPEKKGQQPLAVVLLEKGGRKESASTAPPAAEYDVHQVAEQRIADLEQELQFSRENLQATIEELETSNEELQATNEELLASNEELQSTNEELQSVNEELYTVNAEYQSKIIELTELNNDVDNLFTATQIGTIFLDENLEIRKYTPNVADIYKILQNDVGRPINHLTHNLRDVDPLKVIREVQVNSMSVEQEVRTKDGHWYLMRVMPYHIAPKTFSGVLMTFIDIHHLKSTEEEKQCSEARLRDAIRIARVGNWEFLPETQKLIWTDAVRQIHEVEPDFEPTVEKALGFCAPESRPLIETAFHKALADGESYDLELQLITARDNLRWVRSVGHAEKGEGGRIVRVYGALKDISTLKFAEEKERIAGLFMRGMNQWNGDLMRGATGEALIERQCRFLVSEIGYRLCWVGLRDGNGGGPDLRVVALAGAEDAETETVRRFQASAAGDGYPARLAVDRAEPVFMTHLSVNPDYAPWRHHAAALGYAAFGAAPLPDGASDGIGDDSAAERKALGVLSVYSERPDAFDPFETEMVTQVARMMAAALLFDRKITGALRSR